MEKPVQRPANPNFSCGPCTKRPGWTLDALAGALLGRSHRSPEGRARLAEAIDLTKKVLELPVGFEVAIVPASDTGAFEMAMWNLLGTRGVDALAWESFGGVWITDLVSELKLPDLRTFQAPFGELPDLSTVDFSRDVLFTANGTTSGVRLVDYDWIASDRTGLTLVDATSAIFAQPMDWSRIDVATFSWQKVMGGEAAHGMLIMGPRALARLRETTPTWPLPKLFRLKKDGKIDQAIFRGETINTPSMLCVEDYIDALKWAQDVGGLSGLQVRADRNARVLYEWIDGSSWARCLASEPATRSNTSVCITFREPIIATAEASLQAALSQAIVALLAREGVAYDVGSYRDAPPGLRIWTGATVETHDLKALMPWLDWAYGVACRDTIDGGH